MSQIFEKENLAKSEIENNFYFPAIVKFTILIFWKIFSNIKPLWQMYFETFSIGIKENKVKKKKERNGAMKKKGKHLNNGIMVLAYQTLHTERKFEGRIGREKNEVSLQMMQWTRILKRLLWRLLLVWHFTLSIIVIPRREGGKIKKNRSSSFLTSISLDYSNTTTNYYYFY